MKLMPPEPTEEMLNEIWRRDKLNNGTEDCYEGVVKNNFSVEYKAAYRVAPNIEHEEIAYVATIEGIKKHVTNYQYEKFSDTVKALYEPYQSQEIEKLKREKEMLVEALERILNLRNGTHAGQSYADRLAKQVLEEVKG